MTATDLAVVAAVVERFATRLEEVVERCTAAIWDSVPSYERGGRALKTDVRDAVRENVAALSTVLSQMRDIRREELETIERVGARRAEAGIPLDDVLHAYRAVSRVCWDVLSEECRAQPGDALEAAIKLAEAVLRYTDQISTAVAEAYSRAQRAIVREQEAARREFMADVLYGTDASPEDILMRAHAFGYDLSVNYMALVGAGPTSEGGAEAAVSAAASSVSSGTGPDPIVLQKAEHTIALVPADNLTDAASGPEKMAAELGTAWRFGVGGPAPGLEGIRRAYLEAREALDIGLSLDLPGPVYQFDDLLMYRFLRIEPALVQRFVDQMLGPLITYDERRKGELVKTLAAYFDSDGSVKLAGEALFAHPHTVTYRLRQVERLTGWSLRDAEQKVRLQLALRAYKLGRGRSG